MARAAGGCRRCERRSHHFFRDAARVPGRQICQVAIAGCVPIRGSVAAYVYWKASQSGATKALPGLAVGAVTRRRPCYPVADCIYSGAEDTSKKSLIFAQNIENKRSGIFLPARSMVL